MKHIIENALNHYLALDPESKQRMQLLQDKIVTIELLGISLNFQLVFSDGKIKLAWDNFANPDLTIKGTPLNLLHMSIARNSRARFFAEDVVVEGNMELAQTVLAIFDELDVDWEEQLSRWLGDVPAHQTSRLVRSITGFTKRLRQSLLGSVNEYVHEEVELFPQSERLQHFFREIDELRMDVDRLEARLLRLENLGGEM